jgi:hypothetical protein
LAARHAGNHPVAAACIYERPPSRALPASWLLSRLCSLDVPPFFTQVVARFTPAVVQNMTPQRKLVKGGIVVKVTREDSACSLFVRAPRRVRAQTPQASRKVAGRIGKNPTSPTTIAGMKRYLQSFVGLITKPGGISVVHD